ncbi:hypothetical protein NQ176_g10414 [Zarea fungicola]|uniref:Uncharacterized protein n=1 Tax=Zarea fungicola TaxID=93591 RepID=A0ACC1MHZ2_9HYPO|nr:hypothetical protein NQ176_g10414 [Lecanicillium fungicola]
MPPKKSAPAAAAVKKSAAATKKSAAKPVAKLDPTDNKPASHPPEKLAKKPAAKPKLAKKPAAKSAAKPPSKEKTPAQKMEAAPTTNGSTTAASRKRKASSEPAEDIERTKKAKAETPISAPAAAEVPASRPAADAKPKRSFPAIGKQINEIPTQVLDIYVFGEGTSGELGLGSKKVDGKKPIDVKRPRLNANLDAKTVGVVQIACGGMHVAALTRDNKILTWGVNDQGALGRDTAWNGGLKDMDAEDSDDDDNDDTGINPKESTPIAVALLLR